MLDLERGLIDAAIRNCWRSLGFQSVGAIYQSRSGQAGKRNTSLSDELEVSP